MSRSRSGSALQRAALSCYPRWWREHRSDELHGLLLELSDAAGRPDLRDLVNLAVHGLRLRLVRHAAMTAEARDRTALIASAIGFAVCTVQILFGELQLWSAIGDPLTIGGPIYLAWMLSVVLAAAGYGVAGRRLLVLSSAGAAAVPVIAASTGYDRPRLWILLFLLLISCLAVSGRPAPTPRSRRLLLLLTGAFTTLLVSATGAFVLSRYTPYGLYGARDQYNLGYFAFAGFGIAVILWWTGRRPWAVAAGLNGLVWLSLVVLFPMGARTDAAPTAAAAFAAGVLGSALVVRRRLARPLGLEDRVEQ